VEVGLSVAPHPAVRLDAAWSSTRQTYEEWRPNPTTDFGGKTIELAPKDLGRIGLSLTPSLLRGGFLGAEWVHLGRYWMDPANTNEYQGFSLVHLAGSIPVWGGLTLVTRLHNLTNERYAETSSFNTFQGRRFRPGPPRSFYAGAQYQIGGSRDR
jgi:iron complex outermembrane receptor protein